MIENEWFPKAVGLWRVQGAALACFLGSVANATVVKSQG